MQSPFEPSGERLKQELERWLDSARTASGRALEALGLSGRLLPPETDLFETDTEVLVTIDLPGVSAENVRLLLQGNQLQVSAQRPENVPPNGARVLCQERQATFERSITLPVTVEADSVRAETKDGVLSVTLRKVLVATAQSIPVTRGGVANG